MSAIVTAAYKTFLKEIKERIYKAQYDALKAVNKELINLYWDIGRSIVAKQGKLGWGKAIVETLAKDLQKEFPWIQGFPSKIYGICDSSTHHTRTIQNSNHWLEKLAGLKMSLSWCTMIKTLNIKKAVD